MGAKYDYDQARQFAQVIAGLVNTKVPKITSMIRNPKERKRKVYLDYLQNGQGQTVAAPYCVRPSRFAGVSTPLEWREVKAGLKPEDFTIENVISRFKKKEDLFAPVLGIGINMKAVLTRLNL